MLPRFVLVAAFILCACTPGIEHRKVDGWPKLVVLEHYVPHAEMRDRCTKYASFGGMTEACAEYNLREATCNIWLSAEFPPSRQIIEHERLHCQGYDHPGSDYMQRLVDRWKRITAR